LAELKPTGFFSEKIFSILKEGNYEDKKYFLDKIEFLLNRTIKQLLKENKEKYPFLNKYFDEEKDELN
jgi:hemerythrin-like domain-containing protein